MEKLTHQLRDKYENIFLNRKDEILNSKDSLKIPGTIYFVCSNGSDANNGKTPETAWKTLDKVNECALNRGDGVLFCRGDLFRGSVKTCPGVYYGAYGEGEKPRFFGGDMDYADPLLWEKVNEEKNIWRCTEKMLDAGTLVFNHGEKHSRKLIPSYLNGEFVCRDDEKRRFDYNEEMTEDLDIYWHFDSDLTTAPSRGENFPVPNVVDSFGELYLRCDEGNPGEVFNSVEAAARRHMFIVRDNADVTIDNVCIKYVGMHGVSAGGHVKNLCVTNCEVGWIGGTIQNYFGTDPNYPKGGRGTVTRFGNGIEIYGGCENYTVSNCYIYECYDAGITHQITTQNKVVMDNIHYSNNLIEKCVYGIEYFLNQINGESESCMNNVVINNNIIRLSGYGWGQQRHNKDVPALIKGWSYRNTARNFSVSDNTFDRSAFRMLHLVALKDEYCPEMSRNTYIQYSGKMLGQYGGNEFGEPEVLMFDDKAEGKIKAVFDENNAKVYYVEE